ncbi:DoxX family protein [Phenylobacterium sp.]|uniref:DoxX family protein n=1 Tax=Phenylobacterium sp. TaxID=1871053 RepID=UPI002632DAE0|nr:DoxX family protein [Phenylobacterium sp.]
MTASAPIPRPIRRLAADLARGLEAALPAALVLLAVRLGLAAVFWLSGRTKVEGVFSITDSTYFLFAEEYRLPLIDSRLAAVAATTAEHLLPFLLTLGLFTRLSAAGLLAMTLVIQVFVYPGAWGTHLGWAALALVLLRNGGGRLALDRWIGVP